MEHLELFSEFKKLDTEYNEHRTLLDTWKTKFQDLSKVIDILSAEFEKQYNEMTIMEDLPEELKEKLENRLEGVRLSVKTVSRLQRKLNLEKPVEERIPEYIFWEDMKENNDSIIVLEAPSENEQVSKESLKHFEEVLTKNEESVEEVKAGVEAAEKRFVTFIEKALAPVMDGLYSGNIYAQDLIVEVNESFPEHSPYVDKWLTVYTILMSRIKDILDQYSVGLLIPEKGQFFNELEHEPLVIMEDPSMENEQIKEVIRYGYYYQGVIYKQERFIIRPAQVSVVKNTNIVSIENDVNDAKVEAQEVEEHSEIETYSENSGEIKVEN